jgi:hypothetical protein
MVWEHAEATVRPLGHVWSSEDVGSSKDWEKVIYANLRAREVQEWKEGLQRKSKLRLYRTLKKDLRRESYLALPLDSRRKLTEMRSGTHCLRIETGRWEKEPLEQRICKVCVCGPIEDELHVLLDCYPYEKIRQQMFQTILVKTAYDPRLMLDDREWLKDFLLGCGVSDSTTRVEVSRIVGKFLNTMLRRRQKILLEVSRR